MFHNISSNLSNKTNKISQKSLLGDPNPNSPANNEAARLFQENKREYHRRVREIVEKTWTETASVDDNSNNNANV